MKAPDGGGSLIRLTPDQVASYNRDGFMLIEDVFPNSELDSISREIDRLRREKSADGTNQSDVILRLGLKSELTRRVCRDERILTLIEDLVKPGIAIYSAKLFEKRPRDTMICHWHQDDAYYQQNSHCDCRMSAWIPLQDCDAENGCVWVLPGSHHSGLRPAEMIGDDTGHCELAFAHGTTEIEGTIPVPVKAGAVLLFHALLAHRSLGNQTDRPRRSFIISYQDAVTSRGNKDQHKILRPAI
jgi:ectoine hydroxylase-related dioxygenase (phytanoyl-CoA dioxygenase family)